MYTYIYLWIYTVYGVTEKYLWPGLETWLVPADGNEMERVN